MNKIIKIFIIGMLLADAVILTWVCFTAYTHETKSTVVYINEYKEANIEMILMPLVTISGAYLLTNEIKELKSK